MKNILITFSAAIITISFAWATAAAQGNFFKKDAPPKLVTAEDCLQAGFKFPKEQPPTDDGNYPASAAYFWVGGSVKPNPVNNLVMVSATTLPPDIHTLFDYGVSRKSFAVSGGIGKEATLVGTRTAINFIKSQTYVVVIGPTATETEALAVIAASKIK